MKDKSWYPIVYMFLVTAVFSTALIVFARLTQERVDANTRIDFERAVLQAVQAPDAARMSSVKVHELFVAHVTTNNPPIKNALIYTAEGKTVYAVPFEGQGFWDEIKGVIGIETDMKTITGFAVYDQNETPGLGAEITKPYFRDQFAGLEITKEDQPIKIKTVAQGTPEGKDEIAAITGATQTSTRLEKMINAQLRIWLERVKAQQKHTGN